ncbi:hypothetical protein [Erythrobacter sp.]|uniref:hypothetical protein n=1 Tax=Erythrobacter sp. TaxID=1042 RepID=UPI001B1E4639|nr:hypothetical protein [Erythrobacter sp.]MBO6528210.1 hypothetical protein [Erythrobacter sp.]MBO6528824.1 hypothetical protein [Erythrobacter sp.]
MKRVLIVLALLVAGAAVVWATIGGGLQGTVEERLENELVARGLPEPMAECMATRMAERLSVGQIRKLENLRPEEGEADIPLSVAGFLERVRRVDDPEVVEVAASSAAICAFSGT